MKDPLTILNGDCVERMRELPDECAQTCVTSPPYFGLRDYQVEGQIGLEKSPAEYVARLVEVFREVRRVLKPDGTLWLNLGDSYANDGKWGGSTGGKHVKGLQGTSIGRAKRFTGLKPKDLIGIPWAVAFALRADGWWLRSDIIWAKPNCMPESVTDRPTRSHEYLFLLTKAANYFYDADAIKEPPSPELVKQIEEGYNGHATKDFNGMGVQDASATKSRIINGYRDRIEKQRGHSRRHDGFNGRWDALSKEEQMLCGSNKRDVWTVSPASYTEAHFATFPTKLIEPCIKAGSRPGDMVLDPFAGSGTTGQVAIELGRRAILIELNPTYVELIKQRCLVTPGLAI